MEKWILVVGANCADEAREAEFNEWYDKTHLPDILETPGFTEALRYENTEPAEGQAKYIAVYRIETDDISCFLKAHEENVAKKREAGRFHELLVVVSRALYKQIGFLSR